MVFQFIPKLLSEVRQCAGDSNLGKTRFHGRHFVHLDAVLLKLVQVF